MKRVLLVSCGLMIVIMVAMLVVWRLMLGFLDRPASTNERNLSIVIPDGITPTRLDALLFENKLLTRKGWLQSYLSHFREDIVINPGEYSFVGTESPADIIDRIERKLVVTHPFILKPGTNSREIFRQLEKMELAKVEDLQKAAGSSTLTGHLRTVEGFLFPDAYEFARGMSPLAILSTMVKRYKKRVPEKVFEAGRKTGLNELELVTLASILEVEARSDERNMFSAVYHNRLKAGMNLEAASVLAYGLKKKPSELTEEDKKRPTAWNTYLNPGLPPTPIASPSLSAISAAARPAYSKARYAVPRGDSTHEFCFDRECYRIVLERQKPKKRRRKKKRVPPPPPDFELED